MTSIAFADAIHALCSYFDIDESDFAKYASEDKIGGYPEKWPVGSIWEVEGKVLYAIVRCLRPKHIVEFGTRYGCSTAHIVSAMDANGIGRITTVDIVGNSLAQNMSSRIVSIRADGKSFSEKNSQPIDIIFEDGPHTTDFTREVIHNCLPFINKGGVVMAHDVGHLSVGQDVSEGFRQAVGNFGSVLIKPSDCGIGYWKKT